MRNPHNRPLHELDFGLRWRRVRQRNPVWFAETCSGYLVFFRGSCRLGNLVGQCTGQCPLGCLDVEVWLPTPRTCGRGYWILRRIEHFFHLELGIGYLVSGGAMAAGTGLCRRIRSPWTFALLGVVR